ncbi:MAG: hypothetical protein KDE32_05840, partial [Novosphingobium sp.]|nr:hypothetical protein [Novosphingobium sp.]
EESWGSRQRDCISIEQSIDSSNVHDRYRYHRKPYHDPAIRAFGPNSGHSQPVDHEQNQEKSEDDINHLSLVAVSTSDW